MSMTKSANNSKYSRTGRMVLLMNFVRFLEPKNGLLEYIDIVSAKAVKNISNIDTSCKLNKKILQILL